MNEQPLVKRAALESAWLETLSLAVRPLSKPELLGRTRTRSASVQLARLLASGQVVNLGTPRVMALVTRSDADGRFAVLQLAQKAVLDHLGLSLKPLSLAAAALAKVKVVAGARSQLRKAVAALVDQGLLVPVKVGSGSLVIATAGIRHALAQRNVILEQEERLRPRSEVAAPTAASDVTPLALRQAYAQALRPSGSMVEMGALQRQLGCELPVLHACLLQMLDTRQIFLVVGEPAVLAAQDLAAGLPLDGVTYYCVELCQG
jgi:hypothetical protein